MEITLQDILGLFRDSPVIVMLHGKPLTAEQIQGAMLKRQVEYIEHKPKGNIIYLYSPILN